MATETTGLEAGQVQTSLAVLVGTTIRHLMVEKRPRRPVSTSELARELGVTRDTLRLKLNGDNQFTVAELETVGDFFNVHPAYLLSGFRIDPGTMSQIRCSVTDPVTSADVIDLRQAPHLRERAPGELGSFTLPTFDDLCGHPAGSRPAKRHDSAGPGRGQAASRGPGRGTSNVPRHRDAA